MNRWHRFLFLVAILPAFVARGAEMGAQGLHLQEDFSSDPSWITDQPANYYWDSAQEIFRATTLNAQASPSPTRYAYALVDYDGQSIRLEFDLELTELDVESGVHFGLYDSNLWMGYYDVPGLPDARFLHAHPARNLNGDLILSLRVRGLNGIEHVAQIGTNLYSLGVWYHIAIEFDAHLDRATLLVTERTSGSVVGEAAVIEIGGLPADLDYLGFARDPAGNCCPPNGGGCGESAWCTGGAQANLDNVVLSEVLPSPIPVACEWALLELSLAILVAATIVLRRATALMATVTFPPSLYQPLRYSDHAALPSRRA